MSQIPDDSYYNAEPDEDCDKCSDDWKRCPCERCRDLRDEYADMKYQEMKDREFDK